MGTKTISIMDDVYDELQALKAPGESFSDELRRLAQMKGNIMELAGAWQDVGEKEAAKVKEALNLMKKGTRLQELKKKAESG